LSRLRYFDGRVSDFKQERLTDTKGITEEDGAVIAPPHTIKVRFLGLFETVHSMGMPGPNTSHEWHNRSIAPIVEHCAHALAGNEDRVYFEPSILERIPGTGHKIEELIFPGVHSDVGGHRDNNPFIMTVTRSWMAEQATKAGVPYLRRFIISEEEKESIRHDPEKIKPGPEGTPDENFILRGNPLYWEHERVQFANRVAQNPLGKALEGALVVTAQMPAPGITSLASDLLKPGDDTFARQPRKLHQKRNFDQYEIKYFINSPKIPSKTGDSNWKAHRIG
jgi:hypothetical protein